MARTFVLPDLGEGLIEAEIRAVLVHEGDVVKEDSPLLEVETAKAQVEIPSPFAGRVEKIHVHPGQTVKVGEPLVSFADGGGAGGPAPAPLRGPRGKTPPPPGADRKGRGAARELRRWRRRGCAGTLRPHGRRAFDAASRARVGRRASRPAGHGPRGAAP